MQDSVVVAVSYAIYNLLKYTLGLLLMNSPIFFDPSQQVARRSVLHDYKEVGVVFKHLQQSNDVHVH